MKSTFNKSLNFATWVIKDPSPDKIRKVAQIVSEYSLFSIHLRGVVVYYSGHGGSKNGKEYFALASDIFDSNELTSPFEPANPKCRLEDRYRLFLFDCCLTDIKGPPLDTAAPIITANSVLPHYQPSVDFTVVAHAGYVREPSIGNSWEGGIWTHCLCQNIREYAAKKKIFFILSKTREDVINLSRGKVQAPFFEPFSNDFFLKGLITYP